MSTELRSYGVREYLLRLLPFGIAVCGLTASVLLADVLVKRELAQLQARTDAESKHVAAQVRVGVRQAFDPLQRIGTWWLLEGRPLAPEDWDTDAQLFVSARSGLDLVTWISADGKRSWSVQPGVAGDPDTIEAMDPELSAVWGMARKLDSLVVSPVFVAGDTPHLYACSPVRRQGKVAGYIAGRYDANVLVRSVLDGQLPDDFSVVVTANGHEIPVIRQAQRGWASGAKETRIALANVFWSVRVVPSGAEVVTLRRLLIGFGVLIAILLYACAAMALIARRRAAELSVANGQLRLENGQRRRAEERVQELNRDLQRRLEEFRILLDVLPVGIAVAEDPQCRNIWMNRSMAGMLHVPVGQNISKSAPDGQRLSYRMLHNGVEVPADQLPMQTAARRGAPVENQELDIVRADGSMIHTLSYSAPLFDEAGKVRGVIDACVDITDRKRAEEERRSFLARRRELEQRVERAEKYRSLALMAGGIAHDFNNVLTVIIGQANLLALDLPESGQVARKVSDLLAAANRAAHLTAQLLAFTGRIWCEVRPVDLSHEIASLAPVIREMVPEEIAIEYDLDTKLPIIRAGIPELQQVIRHLIANAVEAMDGRAGKIEIRTSRCELTGSDVEILFPDQPVASGHYVRIEVTDNGCGIAEEIAGRVFDPFFTTKFVGRGLGLSAVQGIVRAHGGATRLESTLHHGTRVEIVLPLEEHPKVDLSGLETAIEAIQPGRA